jgi:hypothetical protein
MVALASNSSTEPSADSAKSTPAYSRPSTAATRASASIARGPSAPGMSRRKRRSSSRNTSLRAMSAVK